MKILVALLLAVVGLSAHADAAAASAPLERSYSYGPAELTAFYDADRVGAPALLTVHGGYWRSGGRSSQAGYAQRMRARGYQVFTIDYRLSTVASWNTQRHDVIAALAWVRAHADHFGVDPKRIVLLGESAGGQIVTNVAANLPASAKVIGTVDAAGPVDPYAAHQRAAAPYADAYERTLGRAADQLLDCPPSACFDRWADAWSASAASSNDGDYLLLHSADDPVVPVAFSRSYARRLDAAGLDVTLKVYPGDAHQIMGVPAAETAVTAWVDARLQPTKTSAAWRRSVR